MNSTVVIVEDDLEIADILQKYLQAAELEVKHFADGVGVVEWVKQHQPAVMLLDLDLPTKQGADVCREIRQFSQLPIIMTTAKVEEVDRLIGLEIGADDYVCKPYSVKELVARVKVQLRRLNQQAQNNAMLQVDPDAFCVGYQGQSVELTAIEFKLFYLLYSHPNRIYSRSQIMDLVYQDYRDVSERTVDSHIRNVRSKLARFSLQSDIIRSIYGAGYKFEPT
ncbi:response regulator [Rheinheimera aquimaris]|jgi:two-component system response regulator BaeR|uniref:response regulator n=1 Tax=Rheinheimera aquimaris TaxID=412437 RepID=UPI000E8587BA|nr:response regulator [Rheinheimera aquimaris]HBN89362.1 two-component system response regulator BaeR [Rheinheimera sp.]|tara:strand:+ start:6810 stop:7478 length:669 start_codon:yes stop_codon:yes gene_type:complete